MQIKHFSAGRASRPVLFLVLTLLFASACGLGLDTQARLERAETALADREYRAAIIDAKNILQDEPDNLAARLVLGRASVEIGDGASAEKEFRRALELGAGIDTVLVDLGRALLLLREFDTVIDEIDPALASNEPEKLAAMRVRGDALIGTGDTEAARDVFTEVLNADPQDVAAFLGVTRTYVAERNYFQAREVLRNALELDEEYIPSWLASGHLATRTGDLDLALTDYTRATLLAQKAGDKVREMEALAGQANAVLSQQNVDAARVVLERMQLLAAQDPRSLLVSARIAAADEDWSNAQEDLQEILRRMPNHRQAQMLLGYVQKESGNLVQAEMYLSAVVNAVPGDATARRLLAETRLMMNKADEARQALEPLMAEEAPGVQALSMAAAASLSLDEFEDATEILERGIEAAPDNVMLKIQLGFAYYSAGDPGKARAILEAISPEEVGNNEFRRDSLLVLSKMAQGERDVALAEARGLRDRMPQLAAAQTLAGIIEMSTGKLEFARASFAKASQLRSDDIQPIRYLAQLDELEDKPGSAKERYELILQLQPDDVRAMVSLAKLAAKSEDHVTAREWLQKARGADPKAVAPRRILGSLLLALREFDSAEEVLSEALKLKGDEARLHELMGRTKLSQGFFRDAENSFGRAMELEPENPAHRLNLARSQSGRGNKSSALATLQELPEQTMSHIQSAAFLSYLLVETGNINRAKEVLTQLRSRHPGEAMVDALEAELEARAGNLVEAAESYDKVLNAEVTRAAAVRAYQIRSQAGLDDDVEPLIRYLENRPLDIGVRVYLANAYQQRGELPKANIEYERILVDDEDNFIAANNLAWNYYIQGDARAEKAARNAYAIEPNSGAVADTLGWILVKKGSVKEGIEMLRKAVDLSGGRPEVRYHLATALVAGGQIESARLLLEEILGTAEEFEGREEAEKLLAGL
jgi:putative PEP-CTERM system TPR-repeat lipoprotein